MTIPQDSQDPYAPQRPESANSLAAAVAIFLGGYLLLIAFNGSVLSTAAANLFATFGGRPTSTLPESYVAILLLQFAFAIVVVVAGIFLARGPATGRLIGVILVVGGSLMVFVLTGMRLSGTISLPQPIGTMFQAVFTNSWFVVVLVVGAAWLLTRRAGAQWLTLLGTLLLLPIPTMLTYGAVDSGTSDIVMYGLSGIVGAGIIFGSRPWRT